MYNVLNKVQQNSRFTLLCFNF